MLRGIKVTLLLAVLTGPLRAQPGPSPGSQLLEPLFQQADLVCNCQTRSVNVSEYAAAVSGKDTPKWDVKALLEVRDIYKSAEAVPPVVAVEYEETHRDTFKPSGPRLSLKQDQTALVFLRLEGEHYSLVNSPSAVTPFSNLPQLQIPESIEKLRLVLATVLGGADRQDRVRSLQLLEGFENLDSASLAAVEPWCSSDDPEIAFAALGVLLKTNTPESVEKLRMYLDSHVYNGDAQPFALASLGSRLGKIRDIRALPSLEDLSASGFIAVRLGAMDALRSIKSRQSVPTLVKRLDDPNSAVQYLAVIALSEILGKSDEDHGPTMNLFDKKPQYYITLWKQWWAEEGSKLYSTESK